MGGRLWTQREDEFLISNYSKMKIREIANVLPRSFFSIHHHAKYLGLIGVKAELYGWTNKKTEFLIENYPRISGPEIARTLGISYPSVSAKACKLGLRKAKGWARGKQIYKGNPTWTEEEIEILQQFYPTRPNKELTKILPKHSEGSIIYKATDLGIYKDKNYQHEVNVALAQRAGKQSRINAEERRPSKELLIHLYDDSKLTLREVGRHLGVCHHTVKSWFDYYGIEILGRVASMIRGLEGAYRRGLVKRPTRPEQRLIDISDKYNLPLRYTGNKSFWIETVNPDFVEVNGKKICIEVFGDYWHDRLLNSNVRYADTEEAKRETLKKYGWKCIVLWESALMAKNGEEYALRLLGKGGIKCHFRGS